MSVLPCSCSQLCQRLCQFRRHAFRVLRVVFALVYLLAVGLVRGCLSGDEKAFDRIVGRSYGDLYIVLRRNWSLVVLTFALIPACSQRPAVRQPLDQRVYVWQRQWTSAVSDAVVASEKQLDGVVALGAELEWNGAIARPIESNIDWKALRHCKRCGIALRIAPIADLKNVGDRRSDAVAAEVRRLFSEAEKEAPITELQLDFDCAEKDLLAYSRWVAVLRRLVTPARLVITALPAWLDSAAFPQLIANCDSYVLQVHSVPLHKSAADWKICDPALAQQWVARAAAYKKPFAVALPTYRCIAGYTPAGRLLGVTMDSVQGRWPPDTRLHEVAADPDDLADLIQKWQKRRPAELREIIWYRLPVATDARNWRFATLAAVANGRRPRRQVDIVSEGTNPVDIAIRNNGEADERLRFELVVSSDEPPIAADALRGCSVELREAKTIFATNDGEALQVRPGETYNVGWLRFASRVNLQFQLVRH